MDDRQRTLAQKTAEDIIRFIAENKISPGDRLPTEKLMAVQFNVSRSVLREALSILSAMRVIRLIQGSGIYVESPESAVLLEAYQAYMDLGYANTNEMYEFRIHLEAEMAAMAARHIDDSGIERLERCLALSKQALYDSDRFSEADEQFHRIVEEYCPNRLYRMNYRSILEIVQQYRSLTIQYLDIRKPAFEHHRLIYDAIRNHNSSMARIYMEEHLREVKRAADFYKLFTNV